jgi:hypothetical protein
VPDVTEALLARMVCPYFLVTKDPNFILEVGSLLPEYIDVEDQACMAF